MKTNNKIILAVAAVASGFLLWLWYHLGFNKIDAPLDLALACGWWAAVAGLGLGIHKVEKTRQERVRTCYINDKHIFNSEAGAVPMTGADQVVNKLYSTLVRLDYGMNIAEVPTDAEGNKEKFDYVVRSKVFNLKREDTEDGSREKLDWQGEVAVTKYPNGAALPFANREELQAIMARLMGGTPAAA